MGVLVALACEVEFALILNYLNYISSIIFIYILTNEYILQAMAKLLK